MNMGSQKIGCPVAVLAGLLLLSGCGNQNQSQPKSSQSTRSATSKTSRSNQAAGKTAGADKVRASSKTESGLWDTAKDDKLAAFISDWAPTMNQSYVKYDGHSQIKTASGTTYPRDLNNVIVQGRSDSIGWSRDGTGHYDYNVVAIYNYDGEQARHITYFFAFHNGQPIAMVDQSTNGTPDLKATQNTKVQENFETIAGNGTSTATSRNDTDTKRSSTALVRDVNVIGLLVRLKAFSRDDIQAEKEFIAVYKVGGKYWIGTGTALSDTGFTIDGNMIHYYTKDYSGGRTTAEAGLIQHTISLRSLQNEFYATSQQQATIQDVAAAMPEIENEDENSNY